MPILLATHDSRVAGRCDRIIRLRDGKVTADGPADADAEAAAPRRARRGG